MKKIHLHLTTLLLLSMLAACSSVEKGEPYLATATLRSFSSSTPTLKPVSSFTPIGSSIPAGPTPTPFVHIIQLGETLMEIAFRYGVQFDNIILANPEIDPNLLRIGEKIRIPGPEGEPVDILLPTPTPIPVHIKTSGCYESPSLTFVCLISVSNTEEFMVAGVSAQIALHDLEGQIFDNQIVYSPINQIPSGQEIPLIAIFDHRPPEYSGFLVELLSAVQVADLTEELPSIDGFETRTIYKAGNRLAEVSGKFSITFHEGEEFLVRIVGVALDAKGEPIGMNIWEELVNSSNSEETEYRLSIFSLGPEIADISIHPEVTPK
ncbi:MAG: LysM peptidoglycan-binding domain-containing protein [Anaerolineales bacterium]|nr:LysM peptidoglycan-binding domain-containing protein [Anaerolineales bacterium]